MTRRGSAVLSMLLWTWGGTMYFLLEVAYKTLSGRENAISWTMLVLAVFLCIPIERCGAELPWDTPLWLQALGCAVAVTAAELAAGLILNVWLGLGVWDYSRIPFNLWGQICLAYFCLWGALSLSLFRVSAGWGIPGGGGKNPDSGCSGKAAGSGWYTPGGLLFVSINYLVNAFLTSVWWDGILLLDK